MLELGPGVLQHRAHLHLHHAPDQVRQLGRPVRVHADQQVPAGVTEPALLRGPPTHVPVVDHPHLRGQQLGDRLHITLHVGDHPHADLVGDVPRRVRVGGHAVDRAGRLLRERGDGLRPPRHRQVVDPGVVEHPGDECERLRPGDQGLGPAVGVRLDGLLHRVRRGCGDPGAA